MKDKTLRVLYHRFDGGGLVVWVYRGSKLLVSIDVSEANRVRVFEPNR